MIRQLIIALAVTLPGITLSSEQEPLLVSKKTIRFQGGPNYSSDRYSIERTEENSSESSKVTYVEDSRHSVKVGRFWFVITEVFITEVSCEQGFLYSGTWSNGDIKSDLEKPQEDFTRLENAWAHYAAQAARKAREKAEKNARIKKQIIDATKKIFSVK